MRKRLITLIAFLYLTHACRSQEQVKWGFSAKKIADKTYELHLKASVQKPWHMYSQNSPKGGALPTAIVVTKHPLIELIGKPKEVGKLVSKKEEMFKGLVLKYFDGDVDFVQTIKLKANAKTVVKGNIQYMACNDEECLPPGDVEFSIVIE